MDSKYLDPIGLYNGVDAPKQQAFLGVLNDPINNPINNPFNSPFDLGKLWDFIQPASSWALSQAVAGALDTARFTGDYKGVDRLMGQIARTRQSDGSYAPNLALPSHQDVGFDDNAWIGLDFMQAYRQTEDPKYLSSAEGVTDFLIKNMDPKTGLILEFQGDPHNDAENVVSTGPALQLALYCYQETSDPKYLQQAQQTANASIAKWGADNGNGADGKGFNNSRPRYNAIFFRELMKLNAVAPDPSYTQALQQYASHLWNNNRDPKTGLFTVGTPGPSGYYPAGYDLTDQGACAQIFGLLGNNGSSLDDVG